MTLHSCQSKLCLAESGSMQPHEGFCLCTTVPVGRRSHSEWPLLQVHLSSVSGVGIGTEAVMISFASNLMISISSIIFSFCSLACPSKRFSDGRHFSVERNDKRTSFYGFSDLSAYFYHHSISHRKCKAFLAKNAPLHRRGELRSPSGNRADLPLISANPQAEGRQAHTVRPYVRRMQHFHNKKELPHSIATAPFRLFYGFFQTLGNGCLLRIDEGHQLISGDGFLHQQELADFIQQRTVID